MAARSVPKGVPVLGPLLITNTVASGRALCENIAVLAVPIATSVRRIVSIPPCAPSEALMNAVLSIGGIDVSARNLNVTELLKVP